MKPVQNDRPLPVYDLSLDEIAEWPEDRVDCGQCSLRNGSMCQSFKTTHVPVGVLHRCPRYRGMAA